MKLLFKKMMKKPVNRRGVLNLFFFIFLYFSLLLLFDNGAYYISRQTLHLRDLYPLLMVVYSAYTRPLVPAFLLAFHNLDKLSELLLLITYRSRIRQHSSIRQKEHKKEKI